MKNLKAVYLLLLAASLMLSSCSKDDKTPPVILLTGSDTLYIDLNDVYSEPGYTATDNHDGDITDEVTVSGSVNSKIVDHYIIEYKVLDDNDNVGIAYRHVFVKADKLQGSYHIESEVTGTNEGSYAYNVLVIPGAEYNTLQIKNFCDLGNDVVMNILVNASNLSLPQQSPAGVNTGYEGTISGQGTYNGENTSIIQIQYTYSYNNGGLDNGSAVFTKN
jgi:hypothetical protein